MNESATGCPMGGNTASLLSQSLTDPAVFTHPNEFYRAMRLGDPVHFDEKLGMYLVSRYEDLNTVLRDPITFSQRRGWDAQFGHGFIDELKAILIRDGGGFFPETILLDPPEHTRIRRLTEKAFTAHRVKQLEPVIRRIVGDLIEKVADKGEADAFGEIASPMSARIMCEQLGFNADEVAGKVIDWSNAYVAQVSRMQTRDEMHRNAQLICDAQNYIIARIKERQTVPREDMISDLIAAQLEDEANPKLSFGELVATVRGLANGGTETTAIAITQLLFLIATRADLSEQLVQAIEDDRLLSRFVEEVLRIEPPVRGLPRTTTKEVELGGKRLPANAPILMMFASANDDEQMFECPRTFDASRKNVARHLSFGGGIHICAGMSLARMELKVAAQEMMRRLKDIRLAVPADKIRYRPSIATLSFETLPLKFSRRT